MIKSKPLVDQTLTFCYILTYSSGLGLVLCFCMICLTRARTSPRILVLSPTCAHTHIPTNARTHTDAHTHTHSIHLLTNPDTVDNTRAENGFVIMCRSATRGKFKLAMFDDAGESVRYEEASCKVKDRAYTQAALLFTSFDTCQLKEPSVEAQMDKKLPAVFCKLENFTSNKRALSAGQYLLCVFGDNTIGFGRTNFSIVALPAKNDAPAVSRLCNSPHMPCMYL